MEDDSYSSLVKFDADYRELVERCFFRVASPTPCAAERDTARPQGSRRDAAEHFRSKFEAMEREFRDEFISTSRATVNDGSNNGSRQAQVLRDIFLFVESKPDYG